MVRLGRDSLHGRAEVDEAFIGGLSEGAPGRELCGAKASAAAAVEPEGRAAGRLRLKQPPSSSGGASGDHLRVCKERRSRDDRRAEGLSAPAWIGFPQEARPMKKDKTAHPRALTVISLLNWL